MSKISVLAVTYDGETAQNLTNFFTSLKQQTVQADQIILVIDGDIREELYHIIEGQQNKLPLEIYHQKKNGLSQGLNLGMKYVTSEFVIRCDTDDMSRAERFETQLNLLKNTDYSVVSATICERSKQENSFRLRVVPAGKITSYNLGSFYRNPINHNCAAFRIKDVLAVGGYPTGRMEDYRLWVNMLKRGYSLYNDQSVLLDASIDDFEKRRTGKDYRLAEWELLKINAPRLFGVGIFCAVSAYLLRVIFRFNFMTGLLKLTYENILRKKL